jgi:hypothetical protein
MLIPGALFITNIAYAISTPHPGLLAALVAGTTPAELRGTAFGMVNLVTGLALLVARVIAGALWDVAGPRCTFLLGVGLAS